MVCVKAVKDGTRFVITGSRIYRFRLTSSGRISGYSPVRGGILGPHWPEGITASPGGSQIAITVGPATPAAASSVPGEVFVINTQTGTRAVWHGDAKVFNAADLTFTNNGSGLEFLGLKRCAQLRASPSCRELREVSPAAAGGQLGSSHLILPLSTLKLRQGDEINDVVISPDGSTLTAAVIHAPNRPRSSASILVVKYSATTGRQLRVLYQMQTGNGFFYRFLSSDPSGRYLLFNAGPTSGTVNGWIGHGRLLRLKPANGSNISYETW
jgi:hypothetical protein